MEANDYDGSYDSSTNWRISGGSLVDSISFESSFSSDAGDLDESAAKSPLLLLPPSPKPDPCEITITFAQRHELRQVYVRSTARVYEVYCANRPKQSNEYLCTVRCGVATRGEEVLQAPVIEATASEKLKEPSNDSEGNKVKGNGSGGSNEDDWVEVKASDASLLNNVKSLSATPEGRTPDFFEATAEINDIEPCISVTLRFLSLQDKGSVVVDEVYIFADPADPTESEQDANGTGNSAGSSLMAMFMPTLLQLSRAKDVNRERDKQTSNESERSQETMRISNDVATSVKGIQHEANLSKNDDQKVMPTTTERADPETSQRVSGAEIKPTSSCNHTDMILHQLVYRVSRIEDILARFEDQLLKPIKSIDTRLQQVEQKLDELGKKSNDSEGSAGPKVLNPDFSGSTTGRSLDIELDGRVDNQHLNSCARIIAPDFSCGDADLDSSCSSKSESHGIAELKHAEDDTSTANSSVNMVDPPNDNRSLPKSDAIAAEISDEKEDGHSVEMESAEEKPKSRSSINDALASALAGFLSSTETADKKYSQALIVTAPDFPNEDDSETDKKAPINSHSDRSEVTSNCLSATERTICIEDSENEEPAVASSTSAQNEPGNTVSIDHNSSEMVDGVAKNCNHDEAGYDDTHTVIKDGNSDLGEGAIAKPNSECCIEGTENKSDNLEITKHNVVDMPENLDLSTGYLTSGPVTPTRGKGEPNINDVLQTVLGFQRPSSSLDFGTPVLDVKFNSEQTSDNKSFFEALLNGSPKSTAESVTAADYDDESNHENLISVDDEDLIGPPTDTLSSVDLDYYETSCMQLNSESETQPDLHRPRDGETNTASLI